MSRFDYINWTTPKDVKTSNNKKKTTALFKETIGSVGIKKYPPVYTLREEEQHEYYNDVWLPSAKKVYMASVDEYSAALRLVGSIEHWNKLLASDWFMYGSNSDDAGRFSKDLLYFKGLVQWREEHQAAQKSKALEMLYEQAQKGNVAAIKALMDGQKPKTRGRPSKEEITGERKKKAKQATVFTEDAERLSKVVNLNRGKD